MIKNGIKQFMINLIGIAVAFGLVNFMRNGGKFDFTWHDWPVLLGLLIVFAGVSTMIELNNKKS
ncbi:hypothetical protein [Weissella minor]|uniref:DUF5668 domain-containing protein n=1 Tax=Weissella minor TaxID=1620 RepID=A0A0R2JT15_9LACO|nr:hypothetical protein [Weissella minor]KRN77786.1 hypothetical protein IV67_GL001312 [Weissella minor]